nr:MAG TPA: hypothetical protein [Caudoviricetes sp.]
MSNNKIRSFTFLWRFLFTGHLLHNKQPVCMKLEATV